MVAVAAVALLALGCTGETDDPTNRPALPATTSTTPASTTTALAAPGSTIDTNFSAGADEQFCQLVGQYVDQFTAGAAPGDVQGFGESLRQSRDLVDQMQAAAPEELVADVVILAQTLGTVVDALEAVDFDLSQVDPEALLMLQDPDFQASAVRLQAFAETACTPR